MGRRPFHIVADGGNFVGMLAQMSLIGIAVVKARRDRVVAFKVEEQRQDFDDPTADGVVRKCCRKRTEQKQSHQKPAHDGTITGGVANSTLICDGGALRTMAGLAPVPDNRGENHFQ